MKQAFERKGVSRCNAKNNPSAVAAAMEFSLKAHATRKLAQKPISE
jgi:hypothetical protein